MVEPTISYIHGLKDDLVKFHSRKVTEQKADLTYYNDTFKPTLLKKPALTQHTGTASRLIDAPAEHIITSNPQAFRMARTKGETDSAVKVSQFLNFYLFSLKRQNPNPFKEHPKNNLTYGEAWLQQAANYNFTSKNQVGLPVWTVVPNPLYIFATPDEDNCMPEAVIVFHKRAVGNIRRIYPEWQSTKKNTEEVEFLAYYSKDCRYMEADKIPLTKGIEPNILKFVPFIHVYSGFGRSSEDGNPSSLAVGRLRFVRDILDEECILSSDLLSLIHRHTYPYKDWLRAEGVPDDALDNYSTAPYALNLLPIGVTQVPTGDILAHIDHIYQQLAINRARLDREMSPLLSGASEGIYTGRQADITGTHALRRYDTIVEATEIAYSIALGNVLRILDSGLDMLPLKIYASEGYPPLRKEITLTKDDIAGYYDCEVKLKAADTLDQERLAEQLRRAWQSGLYDTKTTLVEGYGKTSEEADAIMDARMVDNATILDPTWSRFMGMQYAQKQGIPMDLFMQLLGGKGGTQPPRESEVQTAQGREMTDMSMYQRGSREAPGAGR